MIMYTNSHTRAVNPQKASTTAVKHGILGGVAWQ